MEPIRGKNEITDPYYRYKMEKINFRRDRTKTCITNLKVIAQDIKILKQEYIIMFIQKRLSIKMSVKNDLVIITNQVDTNAVQNALYEFIEHFILCKHCRFPELTFIINDGQLKVICKSCGKIEDIIKNQYNDPVIKSIMNDI